MASTPNQVDLRGFGIANYRSFDSDGFVIKDIKKINVFIGKNNSGKSNILRAISLLHQVRSSTQNLTGLDLPVDGHRQARKHPSMIAVIPVTAFLPMAHPHIIETYRANAGEDLEIRWDISTGDMDGKNSLDVLSQPHLEQVHLYLNPQGPQSVAANKEQLLRQLAPKLIILAIKALKNLERFLFVPVFR